MTETVTCLSCNKESDSLLCAACQKKARRENKLKAAAVFWRPSAIFLLITFIWQITEFITIGRTDQSVLHTIIAVLLAIVINTNIIDRATIKEQQASADAQSKVMRGQRFLMNAQQSTIAEQHAIINILEQPNKPESSELS